jgi:tetratricopeptide (TPR) repeat protein
MKATLLLLAAAPVLACIWDSDTLQDEIRGIPEAEALVVTGRWPRHSRAYYEKRVRELPARIEADPLDLGLYDDLAVAFDRLGRHGEAVAWMDRKGEALARKPDPEHAYRRLANRGTFLAHGGKPAEGLPDLDAAVALNPKAHFGREVYQIDALRYFIAAKADPTLWADESFLTFAGIGFRGAFSPRTPGRDRPDPADRGIVPREPAPTWEEVHTAVAGILRFGGPEGAEVYRALGSLYATRKDGAPGQGLGNLHLAWWAYRRAIDRGHPAADALRGSLEAIEHHWQKAPTGLVPSEEHFRAMKAWGERWLAAFQEGEAAALGRGEEVASEAAQRTLMAAADAVAGSPPPAHATGLLARSVAWRGLRDGTLLVLFCVATGAIVAVALRALVRRIRRTAPSP